MVRKAVYWLLLFTVHETVLAQNQKTEQKDFKASQEKPAVINLKLFGKITDAKSGEPLPGSSLSIADLRLGILADGKGNYIFPSIPAGHHLIEISHIGYLSIVEHIDIEKNTEQNFSLQPSVIENQAVVVTGVSNATSIRKTPIAITAIRRAALQQTASGNIIDAIAKISGMTQSTTGPAISKPVIRGLGFNRVVVLNDGIRQEGQQWGDEHGIEIDELSVNKVEILKGPASLMYGSDAIAGVIHFISIVPPSPGTMKGNVFTNFQSNNNLWSRHIDLGGNKKGFSWNVYQSSKSAKDYKNKFDGRVLNSRMDEKNLGGYVGINKQWGFSHLVFTAFNQRVGLVEGNRDAISGKFLLFGNTPMERIATDAGLNAKNFETPFQHIQHYKLISDNIFFIKNTKLKTSIGFQNNIRKEFGDPINAQVASLVFDLRTLNYNILFVLPEKKEWHTTLGLSGMLQENKNEGNETIIPEYALADVGSFVYVQRFFKKATVSSGIRIDQRRINIKELIENNMVVFPHTKKTFSNISSSVGVSYEPADFFSLKLNLARGFRAPNLSELSSNGAHEGTNRFEYGNPSLKSETSLQADLGVQVDYDHVNFGFAFFHNRIHNYIFYNKLSSFSNDDSVLMVNGEMFQAFRYSQQDATLSGFEINLDIHPHPFDWLHFENAISMVEGRFSKKIDQTTNLPMIPAVRWISDLKTNFKRKGKLLRNTYLKVEMERTFNQQKPFFAFHTETPTPGYTLFNAGWGADLFSKKEKIICQIHLSAMNLTDVAYQNHLSRLKYTSANLLTGRSGVYNMGRNISLKINFPLQFQKAKEVE